jgi:putative ABC transport system substrate-binding protein
MASRVNALSKGLGETGYAKGRNVEVEYHWLEGQYEQLAMVLGDLIQRHVAVMAIPGSTPISLAAKSATNTIPIVFGVAEDPVKLGLVTCLAQPGGNATGINFFSIETDAKRRLLLAKADIPN